MNGLFSVDDNSDSFWSSEAANFSSSFPDAGFTRNQSEWALERFLELEEYAARTSISASCDGENVIGSTGTAVWPWTLKSGVSDDTMKIGKPNNSNCDGDQNQSKSFGQSRNPNGEETNQLPTLSVRSPGSPIDLDEYHKCLKNKLRLDLPCAAVALSRAAVARAEASPSQFDENGGILELRGHRSTEAQNGPDAAPYAIPSFTTKQNSGTQARQATSGSSAEDADDDEFEVDTETTENVDPTDVKRARRMLSNRESARRSRRRKQEQVNDLEVQVGQLRVEHSTLLRHFTDVNRKYDEAAVDNRILKADIETLRAKVKMVEETVRHVTGINPLLSRSSVPNVRIPFVNSPLQAPTDALPIQQNTNQFYDQSVPSCETALHYQILENSFASNTAFVPLLVNSQTNTGVRNAVETTMLQRSAGPDCVEDQIGCSAYLGH